MKRIIILSVILICFFVTGCDNGENENVVIDPPVTKNQELVCAGDFSEDLSGKADMYQRLVLEFDSKGIAFKNGTLYVDVEVYKEDVDHIIGYVHSSEMFRNPSDWHDTIRTMPFVPETMSAQKMMQIFLQQKKSLGVVVDEFGGTSGIVSLEDIVEEIFGEIEDEHDNSEYVMKKTESGDYILAARLEIDKVNEKLNLDLPESDDYMTIGGLILHEFQSFPKLNEIVKIGKYEFKIIKNTMTKIELVQLHINDT